MKQRVNCGCGSIAGTIASEMNHFQRIPWLTQMTGLAGHATKDVRSKVRIIGLFSGLERQQEIILRAAVCIDTS